MSRKNLGYIVWVVSFLLVVAWLAESVSRGRGFISTYLAPFAIIGNVVGIFLIRHEESTHSRTR